MPDRYRSDGTITTGPEFEDAAAVAILAHGRGGSPRGMLDLARAIATPSVRFIMPAAPGASWYPQGFMAPPAHNEPWLSASLSTYARLVDGLIAEGVAPERIVLGGFSQGACLTAEYLIRNPRRYGAALILTGGFIGPAGMEWPASNALVDLPVYLSGSETDAWVPATRVRETERHLRASGAAVTSRIFDDRDHLVSDEEIVAVREMLDELIKN